MRSDWSTSVLSSGYEAQNEVLLSPSFESLHFYERNKPINYAHFVYRLSLSDLLSNSPKCLPQFLPGYDGTENMFYFLDEVEDKN